MLTSDPLVAAARLLRPRLPRLLLSISFGVLSLASALALAAVQSLGILILIVAIWLVVIGVFEIVSAFGIRSASRRVDRALAGHPPTAES